MSFRLTTQRLVVRMTLVSLLSFASDALFAQETDEISCVAATALALNETFSYNAEANSNPSGTYSLELPGPGIVSLYTSTPFEGADVGIPRLSLVEERCANSGLTEAAVELIRQTPQSLLLQAQTAQTIQIAVTPEDPKSPLEHYKLQVGFAEATASPDAIHSLGVNPPESCTVSTAPALGEDPFLADRYVVIDRGMDGMEEDVEPVDCDILDGSFAAPGVVTLEAIGTPLEASFFAGYGCSTQDLLAGGALGSPGSTVAAPVHAGPYRLALDPIHSGPIAYSLGIRHFDLCGLGELDDHGSMPLCASPFAIGDTAEGVIEDVTGGDEDFFTLSLDEQRTVAIDITGNVALTIYDTRGQQLSFDQAEGFPQGFQVVRTLSPGRYYLAISGPTAEISGYTVTLGEIAIP